MAVVSGPVIQTAWVVADVAATEAHLSALTGIRHWTRLPDIRFGPDTCTFRGHPADFTAHIAMAYVGDMQLELIQPVTGESIYSEFLDATGGGLHHLCWEVDDLDAALARATRAGMAAVQTGDMAGGSIRFAYLDGAAHGVPYVELAQLNDAMRTFYAQIKQSS
jgi:catechol 2,3-dioxygenase-like lactoylglutathione lyase family enzyme